MNDAETPRKDTYPPGTVPVERIRTEETAWGDIPIAPHYMGIAVIFIDDKAVKIGFSIHDGLRVVDGFANLSILSDGDNMLDLIRENTIHTIVALSKSLGAKFVAAGVALGLEEMCPGLSAHIWRRLDVVCVLSKEEARAVGACGDLDIYLGEKADSAARECVSCFSPDYNPARTSGFRNQVMPDREWANKYYESTFRKHTWTAVLKYAHELRGYNDGQTKGDLHRPPIKIALFSATPQGGGVAVRRHALVRFCYQLGVDMSWYIPEPDAEAFRIAKTNHSILQGVANPEVRFDAEKQVMINEWIKRNAERYWITPGGPLAPGGADVVVIDDPQMPALIPLIKKARPEVKIIYRSPIEIRKDLVEPVASTQEQVWQWIWDYVKEADVFISHPVDKFVPQSVPFNTIGLMPACTYRLDGLNKPLRTWDLKFYHRNLRIACNEQNANHLLYPAREYITQIARFDPSKGIPDVIESYHQLCNRITRDAPEMLPPQLLICGHVAIDDPDAELHFAETREMLYNSRYATIANDVVVVRIGPSDQMLKAIIHKAKIVLQLSLREGFEVKASEALRHGKPVVATRPVGISLQIDHGKSGFLVDVGDTESVANHLFDLYTNHDLYARMSKHAKASVSDEVPTVGNAAYWFYLTHHLARGTGLAPAARWLRDTATEEGQKYDIGQPILPGNGLDSRGDGQC
ncbi:trehalose phosphorylase [Tuber indicum]|nr:trehalose phosphorylase [Tuber indicum]